MEDENTFGFAVPRKNLFEACTEPDSGTINAIALPFVVVRFDEPVANTNSPFCNEPVTELKFSKLPRLCLIICAIFVCYSQFY